MEKEFAVLIFTEFVDYEHGVLKEEYGVWDTKNNNYSKRDIIAHG